MRKGSKMPAAHRAAISAALMGRERPACAGRPPNTPETLWSKVDKRGQDECWPWKGHITKSGYGRTWIGERGYYAHRVIFALVNPGAISLEAPSDRDATGFLIHSCDNPPCCNPAHLRIANHAENMADKKAKGRAVDFSGDKGPRCKLTMDQAREIRRLRKDGMSARDLSKRYRLSLPSIKTLLRGDSYKE